MTQVTGINFTCGHCGRPIGGLQTWLNGQAYHPECTRGPDYKPEAFAIPSGLTVLDSARVADAAIEMLRNMERRWDSLCATIEQQVYIKNNPTKW